MTEARFQTVCEVGDQSCAKCGYSLRGTSPEGSCPECALPVKVSLERDPVREHLLREDRILEKLETYRRNRTGSLIIAIGHFAGLIVFVLMGSALAGPDIGLVFMMASTMFGTLLWCALAYAFHARSQYAQSIRYHRNLGLEQYAA